MRTICTLLVVLWSGVAVAQPAIPKRPPAAPVHAGGSPAAKPPIAKPSGSRLRVANPSGPREAAAMAKYVGHDCVGRGAIESEPGHWVVYCGDGHSYQFWLTGPKTGEPASECSLAHTETGQNCF